MYMYVEDDHVVDAHANAELARLNEAFTIAIKPAHYFLGNNIIVHEGDAPLNRALRSLGFMGVLRLH